MFLEAPFAGNSLQAIGQYDAVTLATKGHKNALELNQIHAEVKTTIPRPTTETTWSTCRTLQVLSSHIWYSHC